MIGSRTARRYTALLVGAMVVLCQSAAVVNAGWSGTAAAGMTVDRQAAPCHETPVNQAEPGQGDLHQTRCQSGNGVTSSPGLDTFHADVAPPTVAFAGIQATDAGRAPARRLIPSRAESPPLRIVHCCLRI